MPFILESIWLLLIGWIAIKVWIDLRKDKLNDPQLRAMNNYGLVYELLTKREYLKALHEIQDRQKDIPHDRDIAYWLSAKCKMGLGLYSSAVEDCNEALRYNSGFTLVYLERAIAHYHLTEYDNALISLEYVERRNSTLPELAFYRALVYDKLNDERSVSEMERAAKLAKLNT
jgi:tetratricopeptide (TPR) repeat protein